VPCRSHHRRLTRHRQHLSTRLFDRLLALANRISKVTPPHPHECLVSRSPDQFSKFRKRNSSSQQQSSQTKQTTSNNGLDPLQPPQRTSLPLLETCVQHIQHPQPSKLLHDPPITTSTDIHPFPPRTEKTKHIHPLIRNLQQQQQQQQQQRRNFHLLLHQHLNPDFRNLLATRLCARPSSARLLLQ
jgi:hypothetical protein